MRHSHARRAGICAGLVATIVGLVPVAVRADDESLEQRRQRLQNMSPTELLELSRKKERFDQLAPHEQEGLRKLHAEISHDASGTQLQSILDRYHQWLQTLPAVQRAELLSLPIDQRVARIKQIQQEQRSEDEKRFGRMGKQLSTEDQQVILNWLDELAGAHEEELRKNLHPRARDFLEQVSDPRRRRLTLLSMAIGNRARPEGPSRPFAPSHDELESLVKTVSPKLQKELAARSGSKERNELIQEWIRTALFNMWQPTSAELEKFYRDELSATDREWLDAMPRERFQRELRKLYFEQAVRRAPEGFRPPMFNRPSPPPP